MPHDDASREARLQTLQRAEQAIRQDRPVPVDECLAEAEAWTAEAEPALAARALCAAAASLHLLQHHRDGEAVALQAEQLCLQAGDESARGDCLELAARAACHGGDLARALEYIDSGLTIAKAADSVLLEARLRCTMGLCLNEMGRYDEAIDTLTTGYALLETAEEPQVRARLGCNLALSLGLKALHEQEAGLAPDLWRPRAERSRALCERVAAYYRRDDDRSGLSTALSHLAVALLVLARPADALQALDEAESIVPATRRNHALTSMSCTRARIYLRQRDAQGALVALLRGFEAVSRLDADTQLDTLYRLQSEAFEVAGDYRSALESHRRYHALSQRRLLQHAERQATALALTLQTDSALRQAREARQMAERFERQSLEDALTGLGNRRCLDEHLRLLLATPAGHTPRFALALLDFDHFKQINDGFSHATGDAVLRHVAQLLRRQCRPGDLAARLGGDEFAIVLAKVDADTAGQICERLRQAVATELHPLTGRCEISVSIGVSEAAPLDSPQSLLARADEALYAAKRAGRNRVRLSGQPDVCMSTGPRNGTEG
ncbi:MAG: GGDEF domain-containing protein [Pseudomonadota bacterium]